MDNRAHFGTNLNQLLPPTDGGVHLFGDERDAAPSSSGSKVVSIAVRLDRRHVRKWHAELVRRMAEKPNLRVSVELAAAANPRPAPAIAALLQIESFAAGGRHPAISRISPAEFAYYICDVPMLADLTIDFCGGADPNSGRVWRIAFETLADKGVSVEPTDAALLSLFLDNQTPVAVILEAGRPVAKGRLGCEQNGSTLDAIDDILMRLTTFILAALDGSRSAVPRLPDEIFGAVSTRTFTPIRLCGLVVRQVAFSGARRVYKLLYRSPHWRVGWRKLDGPDLLELRRHPATGWHSLADDGHRFYADPFPIERNGHLTVFVEEFPHRTGKGVISAVRFDGNGPVGVPEPVLEMPYHLSYPFVFERDGEVWMIPESCAASTIDLYRSRRFPGGWVKVSTLVSGVVASDATLLEHDGRWWMFATVRDGGGAYSDSLHLWTADDFRGPWMPHKANPVLIDIASARPAGRIVVRDGTLFRPVQDCRRGYGAALGIARITQLDDDGFAQVLDTILTPGPLWPGRRMHTLNSAGGFEFIDGSGRARRF